MKIEEFNETFKDFVTYVNKHIDSNQQSSLNMINVIKAPLRIFYPTIHSGSVHTHFIDYSRNDKRNAAVKKGDTIKTLNEVKFGDIKGKTCNVSGILCDIGDHVYARYEQLVNFLKSDPIYHYIEEVNFIGQPSVYASNGAQATVANGFKTEFSPDVKSNLDGDLYERTVDELHEWYSNKSDDKKGMFATYVYIDKNKRLIESANERPKQKTKSNPDVGIDYNIKRDDAQDLCNIDFIKSGDNQGTNEGQSWHVADIYPSHKLLEMIFFLFGLMTTYIQSEKNKNHEKINNDLKQEYFEMMAPYVVYANYINLCCAVQMEPTWNIKIGNLYVYDYKIKTEQTTGDNLKLNLQLIPMIDDTIKYFAEELDNIGLNNNVRIEEFWDNLSNNEKNLLYERYSSGYLKDIKKENLISNLDKVLYYIRKEKISKRDMHLLIQLYKELEDDDINNKKYRKLVVYAYNAVNKLYCSPPEPETNKFYTNGQFSNEIIEYIDKYKFVYDLIIKFVSDCENHEDSFENLAQKCPDFTIKEDKNKLLESLIIINNIALYRFQNLGFWDKIKLIIEFYSSDIKDLLNEFDLINIFENNPRLFIYLINEKIISFNYDVYNSCMFSKYKEYFDYQLLNFKKKVNSFKIR